MTPEASVTQGVEYLLDLRASLVALLDEHDAEQAALLKTHAALFRAALVIKGPSDQSRKQVESGQCSIGGQQCQLNKDFIDKCKDLATQLEMDELVAAELLQEGAESAIKYDRAPFACAIFLHHTKRQILFDCLRCICEAASDELLNDQIRTFFTELLLGADASDLRAMHADCEAQLDLIKRQFNRHHESSETTRILRVADSSQDAQTFQAIILDQYECLSLVLADLCRVFPAEHAFLCGRVDRLMQEPEWTDFSSFDVTLLIRSIQHISALDSNMVSDTGLAPTQLAATFRTLLPKMHDASLWKCTPIKAILQVVFIAELNGLCRDFEQEFAGFDYVKDIEGLFQTALDYNAFQHLVTSFLFATCNVDAHHPFAIFFTANAFAPYRPSHHHTFRRLLVDRLAACYRTLHQAIVTNLPDQLKLMKLQAEDAVTSEDDLQQGPVNSDHHLELFLGLIYATAGHSADQNRAFWDDPDGDLFGFLIWASYCELPSMIYAYCSMLAAIISDASIVESASSFFGLAQTASEPGQPSPASSVSWPFIFESLRYYVRQLSGKPLNSAYQQDAPEVDAQSTLILKAYLSIVRQVVRHMDNASAIVEIESKYDCLATLFQLMACPLPPILYAALLDTVTCFGERHFTLQVKCWKLFESWIGTGMAGLQQELAIKSRSKAQGQPYGASLLAYFAKSSPEHARALVEFMRVQNRSLTSTAFKQLSLNIAASSSTQLGVEKYVSVVFELVEYASDQDQPLSAIQRIELTTSCVAYLVEALAELKSPLQLLIDAENGLAMQISANAQDQFAANHPACSVIHQLEKGRLNGLVFGVMSSFHVDDPILRARLEPCILEVLHLVLLALNLTRRFKTWRNNTDSKKDDNMSGLYTHLLEEPNLVVHLCNLCSETPLTVPRSAVSVLGAILAACTDNHKRRIITALNSVDQIKPILFGFAQLVKSEGEAEGGSCPFLSMVLADLERHGDATSVAHFILGFEVLGKETVGTGTEPGQIGSGSSVFHEVMRIAALPESPLEANTLAICILARMMECTWTSSIVIDELMDSGLFQPILQTASAERLSSQSVDPVSEVSAPMLKTTQTLLDRRAALSRYSTKALLDSRARSLVAVQSALSTHFLADQEPNQVYVHSAHAQATLCDFLDIFSWSLPTLAVPSRKLLISLAIPAFGLGDNADLLESFKIQIACRLEQLRVTLTAEQLEDANSEASRLRSYCHALCGWYRCRESLHRARQAWINFAVPMLDTCLYEQSERAVFSTAELSQKLFPGLHDALADNESEADDFVDALCLLMSKPVLQRMDAGLQQDLFRAFLVVCQHPSTTAAQREKLFVVVATLLDLLLRSDSAEVGRQAFFAVRSASDKFLVNLCQTLVLSHGVLKLSACVLLESVTSLYERFEPSQMTKLLLRSNLFTQLVDHFATSLAEGEPMTEVVDRQFDLLLRFCMNADLACELVLRSRLFDILFMESASRSDDIKETRRAPMALATMQLVATCCVALKPQQARTLLQQYRDVLRDSVIRYKQAMQEKGHEDWKRMVMLCGLLDEMLIA